MVTEIAQAGFGWDADGSEISVAGDARAVETDRKSTRKNGVEGAAERSFRISEYNKPKTT